MRTGNYDNYKWGCIDKSGEFVIKPIYDYVWGFTNGIAMVKIDGKIGWIDKSSNYIWEPTN